VLIAQEIEQLSRSNRHGKDPIGEDASLISFIIDLGRSLGYLWRLNWIPFIQPIDNDLAQAHHGGMDIHERGVDRRNAQADVVGGAEIGQDLHVVCACLRRGRVKRGCRGGRHPEEN